MAQEFEEYYAVAFDIYERFDICYALLNISSIRKHRIYVSINLNHKLKWYEVKINVIVIRRD